MDNSEIIKNLRSCLLLFVVGIVLTATYTFFILGVTQIVWPYQAHGSLLYVNDTVVGSELIGQSFTSPGYFHGRPSAVDYNASNSGGSNYGATSTKLMDQVKQRVEQVRLENNLSANATVPADLVLASGSGLDPHISPEGAMIQVQRVANARGLPEDDVRALVEKHIEGPQFGFLGAERVNVLKLNIALDELAKVKR